MPKEFELLFERRSFVVGLAPFLGLRHRGEPGLQRFNVLRDPFRGDLPILLAIRVQFPIRFPDYLTAEDVRVGWEELGDRIREGRLPAAALPDESDGLSAIDRQIHAVDGAHPPLADPEVDSQVPDGDKGHAQRLRRRGLMISSKPRPSR